MAYVSRMFDSRLSQFSFLNPLKYLSVQFPSRLFAGNTCIYGSIHVPTFISSMQVDGFLVEKFLVEMRPVAFPLVNFECDAYLAVNHSLFYSYPKMFLPFFSLIVTA